MTFGTRRLVPIEAVPRGIAWEGEGYRKVRARRAGLSRHPKLPASVAAPPAAEDNLLRPIACRRRRGNPHDGEIITHAPNLMWGTDWRWVFTVDDGWGWIMSPPVEPLERRVCRLACLQRGDRFAAL